MSSLICKPNLGTALEGIPRDPSTMLNTGSLSLVASKRSLKMLVVVSKQQMVSSKLANMRTSSIDTMLSKGLCLFEFAKYAANNSAFCCTRVIEQFTVLKKFSSLLLFIFCQVKLNH
jgi:hypothetical protein